MTSKKIGSVFLALWLFASAALGAEISVVIAVDKPTVGLDDELQLDVTIANLPNGAQPEVQGLENFEVRSTGTSTQFQMVNGSTSRQTIYSYTLTPKSAGTFRIGPAIVRAGNASYSGAAVAVQVLKGNTPEAAQAKIEQGRMFKVTASVDHKSPFVNGQIIFTARIYIRAPMQNAQLFFPDFKGFVKEQLGKQKDTREVINGDIWQVTELRYALFPVLAGSLTIPAVTLNGEAYVDMAAQPHRNRRQRTGSPFDEFFDDPMFGGFGSRGELKKVKVESDAITLDVKAFPTPKPPGFAGLVGKFRLETALGKRSVAVGDSTTLSLKLAGEGNLRDATLPGGIDWKGFKTYEDKATLESLFAAGNLGGSKTFKIALVPLTPGKVDIPKISFPYLDPSTGRYAVAETPPLTLDVTPGSGPEALNHVSAAPGGSNQKDIQALGEDVMPIKRELSNGGSAVTTTERAALGFFILGFPLIYLFGWAYERRRAKRMGDAGWARREKAFRNFQTGLQEVPAGLAFYEGASGVFRTYLGDKLGFDGKALTPADAERKLRPLGISETTVHNVGEILKRLERAQYGGGASADETEKLRGEIAAVGKQLQTEAGK